MKVGRPPKYKDEESRKESRRIQNRRNQRKCRLRKKLKTEIKSLKSFPVDMDKKYREEIVKHFNKYDFNFFFTGTIDPYHNERKELKTYNDEIKNSNHILETSLMYQTEKKIGIKSLRKHTEKYLEFLYKKELISRWFVVFEMGKDYKYHVHIVFGTDNSNDKFMDDSENHWLLGKSLTIPIISEEDKYKTLKYCVKEFRPSSYYINDLNKMDNWFFDGDFGLKKY